MPIWDEAAQWYLEMVGDSERGFNALAVTTALSLLGTVHGHTVLDVGCGEGHVARLLVRAGASVTAVDPTEELLSAAMQAEHANPLGVTYLRAFAEDLSAVVTSSMDAVCAVLVMHHVADLGSALDEVHRVLRKGGRLVLVLPHPWTDHPGAGWVHVGEQPRRFIGDYLQEGYWSSGDGGVPDSVRDIGWYHRSLAGWCTELTGAGFCLSEVREPPGGDSERRDDGGPWAAVPRFLAISATKHRPEMTRPLTQNGPGDPSRAKINNRAKINYSRPDTVVSGYDAPPRRPPCPKSKSLLACT